MSYYVEPRGGQFFIANENQPEAAEALRKFCAENHHDFHHPEKNANLADLLHLHCWESFADTDGNIVNIYMDSDTLDDDKELFNSIAPYVRAGSYLAFEGEDGCIWCYYFDGQHCKEYPGVITFPSIPPTNKHKPIALGT